MQTMAMTVSAVNCVSYSHVWALSPKLDGCVASMCIIVYSTMMHIDLCSLSLHPFRKNNVM